MTIALLCLSLILGIHIVHSRLYYSAIEDSLARIESDIQVVAQANVILIQHSQYMTELLEGYLLEDMSMLHEEGEPDPSLH